LSRLPFAFASQAAIEAVIRHPQASGRHFLRVTTGTEGKQVLDDRGAPLLPAEDEEVEISAFVHTAVEGGMFYLEYVATVLGPIDDRFHHIDRLPVDASDLLLRAMGEAVRQVAVSTIAAPFRLLAGVDRRLSIASRMNRAERRSHDAPQYNYGARTSVRQLASDRDPDTYVRLLDAEKYGKLIERRVTSAVLDYLDANGIDTAEYSARVNVIHNSGTHISNSIVHGPVAGGPDAVATMVSPAPANTKG
jgi:hypothetical protein